ncbi:hypothetical protein [Rhodobacter maris]|uniref:Uncharacterized protein n=1 Tax=Rhodobacter maris TaxID=446682 RepID=A0A285STE7_9RHOB|nr:hypothetical protein [Rhodobacter maris]SOC09629.1 hypothetical protein SAMN05877831_107164 [Rhodobacter maris]
MTQDHLKFTFVCKQCGANPATLELPENYTDNDTAKCKACGAELGRYGDIKAEAMRLGKQEIEKMVKDTFKGLKGWKVK